jgi:hypothetical protein
MPRKKPTQKPLLPHEFYIKDLVALHLDTELEETGADLTRTYKEALRKCSSYLLQLISDMTPKERQEYDGCILTDLIFRHNKVIPNAHFRHLSYATHFWQRMGFLGKNCRILPETGIKRGVCNIFRFPLPYWYFADRRMRLAARNAYRAMKGELNCACVKFSTPDWEVVVWDSGRVDTVYDVNSSYHEIEVYYGYGKGQVQIGDINSVDFEHDLLTDEEKQRKIQSGDRGEDA